MTALREAIECCRAKHPALKTTFSSKGSALYQLESQQPAAFELIDTDEPQRLIDELVAMPFDFDGGPLVKFWLLRQSFRNARLLVVAHRSIFDGTSKSILIQDLAEFYNAYIGDGSATSSSRGSGRYWDVLDGLLERARKLDCDAQEFFTGQIAYGLDYVQLGQKRNRDSIQCHGAQIDIEIAPEALRLIRQAARNIGVSSFIWHLTLFCLTVASYDTGHSVTVSVAVNMRPPAGERMVGMFSNNLPVHQRIEPECETASLAHRLRENFSSVNRFRAYPISWIERHVQALDLGEWSSLSQMQLSYRRLPVRTPEFDGLRIAEEMLVSNRGVTNDICMACFEYSGHTRIKLRYSTDLLDKSGIKEFAERFRSVARSASQNPAKPVSAYF